MGSRYAVETVFRAIDAISAPLNKIGINSRRVSNALKDDFARAGKSVANFGNGIKRVGGAIAAGAGIAISAFVTQGVQNTLELGTAMAKVGTIADTAAVPIDRLQSSLLSVSSATGQAVSELAASQYEAISSGIATADSVKFVDQAVRVAKGGFTDTATAVDALTTVLNAYGLSADSATKISDQMIVAQNLGKTTFGDMAQSIGNVIPIASALNVGTDELFSSIATLTSFGINTSASMTGMKAALSNIIKPTAQAAEMAEALGLDFSAAALQSKGLKGFLDSVAKAAKGDQKVMATLFGSVEALNAVTVLTGKGADLFSKSLNEMAKSAGATDAAFKKMQATPAERMNMALNKVQNAGIKLGTAFLPIIEKIADKISDVADSLLEYDFGPIARDAGVALDIFFKFVKTLWDFKELIGGLIIAWQTYRGVMIAVNIVTSANPLGAVLTVVGLLISGIMYLTQHWDEFNAAFKRTAQTVDDNSEKILGVLSVIATPLSFILSLIHEISDRWDYIKKGFEEGGFLEGIKRIGGTILSAILAPIQGIVEILADITGDQGIRNAAKKIQGFRDEITGINAERLAPKTVKVSDEIAEQRLMRSLRTTPVSAAPVTAGERSVYTRNDSNTTSTTRVEVAPAPGSTARVSGGAATPNVDVVRSGSRGGGR